MCRNDCHCSWPWQVSKVLPGKKVKLELTCFRDRTDCQGERQSMASCRNTNGEPKMYGACLIRQWPPEILSLVFHFEDGMTMWEHFWMSEIRNLPWMVQQIRSGEEGKQETTWVIPVRGGPSYEAVRVWRNTGEWVYFNRCCMVCCPLTATRHFKGQLPPRVEFVKVPQLLKHECLSIYLWLSLTLKKLFELWQKKAMLFLLLGSWCLEQYVSRVRLWICWKPFLFWKERDPQKPCQSDACP